MKKLLVLCLIIFNTWAVASAEDFGGLSFLESQEESGADLTRVEQRLMDFELDLMDLHRKMKALEEEQIKVSNQVKATEIKVSGLGQFSRYSITGLGATNAKDFLGRPLWYDFVENNEQLMGSKANQRVYLSLVGRPISSVEVVTDFLAKDVWNVSTSISLDNIAIKADLEPTQITVGRFWLAFTPLTLYYPTYTPWFESSLFKAQRDLWYEEQKIKENTRAFEGIYGSYTPEKLNLQGVVARVRDKGDWPFHRFLTGLKGDYTLDKSKNLGVSFLSLKDDPKSGQGKALANYIYGVNWAWQNLWPHLSLQGEFAYSSYDANIADSNKGAGDWACYQDLLWQQGPVALQARLLNTGAKYYAPSSQSRDYSLAYVDGIFGPPTAQTAMGGQVATASREALPYGLATPNRRGYQFRLLYPLGALNLALERSQLCEIEPAALDGTLTTAFSSKRSYLVQRIGGELALNNLLKINVPVKLLGQFEQKQTKRGDDPNTDVDEEIGYAVTNYDLGFSYQIGSNWKLLFGQKYTSERGYELDWEGYSNYLTTSAGLEFTISPQIKASFTCQLVNYLDQLDNTNNYQGKVFGLTVKAQY